MRGLEDKIANLLLEDKIDHETYITFINKYQWLGFAINQFIASTLTSDMLQTPPKIKKEKEELLKKYREELDNGDIEAIDKIEKKLMADAKKEIEDIPDYEIYESGCRGSYENNYKNSSLIRK
jgi:ABC-type Zn2+ transport system substrate-binding protein/surface adhesin